MVITREILIKRLSEKSGYYQKNIREVLQCLDDVVMDILGEVTSDEEISVQLLTGLKIGCSIVPERERIDPRNRQPIVCKETCKPHSKFSQDFRKALQENYENNKND